MDWSAEFPGLAHGTYLNSCAHGLLPRRTRAAIERHLDRWEGAPDWEAWTHAVDEARREFARFIGADEDEVAVQANATSGVAAVLNALPQDGPRKRIVTTDADFPTSPTVAERMAVRGFTHTHVRALGAGDGRLHADAWARELGDDAAMVIVPAVASFNGSRQDVRRFASEAHAKDVPLLVDAFQACGTYPIDVHALDVDFLVTGVYKWLLAPAGLAFLYARRDHHDMTPTTSGWYAQENPHAMDPFGALAPNARRFEYGGPSVVSCVATTESLRLLREVGLDNVARHNGALVERIVRHARDRKWDVLTPDAPDARASIVTFRVPDLSRALAACKEAGVVVNSRLGGIRVSPHFYNAEADVDRLFGVLDAEFA